MESSEQIQTYFWFIRFLIVLVCLGILWKIFDSVRNFFKNVRLRISMAYRRARINRKLRKLKRIRINQEFSDYDTERSFIGRVANTIFIDFPQSVSAFLLSPLAWVLWPCWIILGSNLFGNLWEPGLTPLYLLIAFAICIVILFAITPSDGESGEAAAFLIFFIFAIYYIYRIFLFWYDAYSQTYNPEQMMVLFYIWAVCIEASIRIGMNQLDYTFSFVTVLGMDTAGDEIYLINKPIKVIHVVIMIVSSILIYIWAKWVILITGFMDFFWMLIRPTKLPSMNVEIKDIENYISWKNEQLEWNDFVSISGGIQRASEIKKNIEEHGF